MKIPKFSDQFRLVPVIGLLAAMTGPPESVGADTTLQVEQLPDRVRILAGEHLFVDIDYKNYAKPIVYPIYGPKQIPMTRNYPMKEVVAGEATDHPHHKSLWFGHGDVNGVSFWHEEGTVETEQVEVHEGPTPSVTLHNRLVGPDGNLVACETLTYSFGVDEQRRHIDVEATLHALEDQPLRLGDTKEGTMALRVHPNLRMANDPRRGVTTANGKAINSQGVSGADVWGKRAKWVDFYGEVDGEPVGIAFFDHPQNLRHPTYWHARTYGLFAANPFGLSQFVDSSEDGSHTVPADESITFRYRIVLHLGSPEQANVEQAYQQYVKAAQ